MTLKQNFGPSRPLQNKTADCFFPLVPELEGKGLSLWKKMKLIFQDPVMKQGAHETIKSMSLIAMSLGIDKVNSISRQNIIF